VNYFVTAIGTDSGKTVVSSILVEAWKADYWKPVQAGMPTDTDTVKQLTGGVYTYHPEAYVLKKPASPHDAAREKGIHIQADQFRIPRTTNKHMIIEGAGGLMVPLNDKETMVDLIRHFRARVILVADLYLGSINHTMLSVSKLIEAQLPVEGIIFNGDENKESESFILKNSPWPCMFRLRRQDEITPERILELAEQFMDQ
jgi:dethiobiotin synthetase